MYLAAPADCPLHPDGSKRKGAASGGARAHSRTVELLVSDDGGTTFQEACIPIQWLDLVRPSAPPPPPPKQDVHSPNEGRVGHGLGARSSTGPSNAWEVAGERWRCVCPCGFSPRGGLCTFAGPWLRVP